MPGFNVCLPEPEGYGFSRCLLELCELLTYSLRDLGLDTTGGINRIEHDRRNVVVGCHLVDPLTFRVPPDSIVVNTEQIYDQDPFNWNRNVFAWVRHHETWDYSPSNVAAFEERGVPGVKLLHLGHQPQLARIPKAPDQDIDVLFYGSVTDRRRATFEQIREHGLNVVTLFGVFGPQRDEYVSRSKLVLNMHNHASEIFEIVRVHYLLSNSIAVVSEVNRSTSMPDRYRDAVAGVPYQSIPDECARLVRDDAARMSLAERAFTTISRFPQTTFTQALLQ